MYIVYIYFLTNQYYTNASARESEKHKLKRPQILNGSIIIIPVEGKKKSLSYSNYSNTLYIIIYIRLHVHNNIRGIVAL